ncbi:hypothetical protein [Ornithinimicrobium kibberense]|uniref:hypothetical protein n=1 Tax=Ornithinimicrobium kibberense TaxID=282060 RepID=UPI00360FB28E
MPHRRRDQVQDLTPQAGQGERQVHLVHASGAGVRKGGLGVGLGQQPVCPQQHPDGGQDLVLVHRHRGRSWDRCVGSLPG